MEADFSGYATKAGLVCSDGLVIMPNAFQHQDQAKVPLVWQHGHNDPENVLGHAILENRPDGVYAYGFFNDSPKAQHAKGLLKHQDINMLSIWANQLIKRSNKVLHGAIREVSLVLSGANPGALIENVTIRHSDGDEQVIDDEAIIYTGLEIVHGNGTIDETEDTEETDEVESDEETIEHAEGEDEDGETVQDIYDSMNEKQKTVLHFMLGQAVEDAQAELQQDSMSDDEYTKAVEHGYQKGITEMTNVFEQQAKEEDKTVLSHADIAGIVADATKRGSLKDAVEDYALAHGITNIDQLFPDAQSVDGTPEWFARRTEWVASILGGARKSPFSRIKTMSADLTLEDARAKGYVKGTLKKEEFFGVTKRVTTPTTIYKKQKLDRDDMVDITDFDVVAWLKGEMRLMLDEELARAVLLGDGRDVAHEDKINEGNIRPIATDHELYTTVVSVNIDDANSTTTEIIDALVANRFRYRGTGLPNFYTTETLIAKFLLMRDSTGRRIYKSVDEVASELRVASIIPVEAMEEYPTILGVMVNPVDYTLGADQGGQISMFDDFDIDYNQYKYLIETRCCGALTRLKSALVLKKVAGTDILAVPVEPTFNSITGVLSITDTTGVVYKNGATVVNAAGSPYAAIAPGASVTITATPAAGYYFATSDDDTWTFTREA